MTLMQTTLGNLPAIIIILVVLMIYISPYIKGLMFKVSNLILFLTNGQVSSKRIKVDYFMGLLSIVKLRGNF